MLEAPGSTATALRMLDGAQQFIKDFAKPALAQDAKCAAGSRQNLASARIHGNSVHKSEVTGAASNDQVEFAEFRAQAERYPPITCDPSRQGRLTLNFKF